MTTDERADFDVNVMNNSIAMIVHELIPEGQAREWAEAKRDEIFADIAPDVLWGRFEDGTIAIDQDYLGGYLLWMQEMVRTGNSPTQQLHIFDIFRRNLMSKSLRKGILQGEHGPEASKAFLAGALLTSECVMEAEIIERRLKDPEISQIQLSL